jgi:hypothetical protein
VQESSREKVESLVNAFNVFILENHKGNDPEDERIKREWEKFKGVIEENPANTDEHNRYVLALRNALLKEEVSKNKSSERTGEYRPKEIRPKILIDKAKLMVLSKDLKRAVLRNTKDPLDMLE